MIRGENTTRQQYVSSNSDVVIENVRSYTIFNLGDVVALIDGKPIIPNPSPKEIGQTLEYPAYSLGEYYMNKHTILFDLTHPKTTGTNQKLLIEKIITNILEETEK